MQATTFKNIISNEKGILTAEFIFSIVLASMMIIILLSMTSTLSAIEIAQYFAYSTARTYTVAHVSEAKQLDLAKRKFKSLVSNPEISPLLGASEDEGMFVLKEPEFRGGTGSTSQPTFNDTYASQNHEGFPFTGVRIELIVNVLKKNYPMLGKTYSDSENAFSTYLTAFIFREPTREECLENMKIQRYNLILGLDTRFSNLGASGIHKYSEREATVEDNGC